MKKNIVWIEDDTDIIDPVVRPLERAGHTIHRLRDVSEALANMELICKSDLILLDLILPPGNGNHSFGQYPGLELLRQFRNQCEYKQPVIVLSVVADPEVFQELKDLGARIVNKPVLPSILKEEVDEMVGS